MDFPLVAPVEVFGVSATPAEAAANLRTNLTALLAACAASRARRRPSAVGVELVPTKPLVSTAHAGVVGWLLEASTSGFVEETQSAIGAVRYDLVRWRSKWPDGDLVGELPHMLARAAEVRL